MKMNIRLVLKAETDDQLEKIRQAEECLLDAGIEFDTGFNFRTKERDWFLDSLKGAKLVIPLDEI